MPSPSNGTPTGPADLREQAYQAKLAEREAEEAEKKAKRRAKVAVTKAVKASQAKTAPLKVSVGPGARKPIPVALVSPLRAKKPAIAGLPVTPAQKKAEADATPKHPTREAWMLAAVDIMRPWYTEADLPAVPDVSISVGWAGGRGKKVGVRGQCWASHTTSDKRPAVFITPDNDDPLTILGIILHEMNHASDDGVSGHKGTFAKNAATLGFVKPWTSSEGKTDELVERLKGVLDDLGPFPHGSITDRAHGLTGLSPLAPPIQTTRMLKVQCMDCGCIIRMTAKWLNDVGAPTCGCGGLMTPDKAV